MERLVVFVKDNWQFISAVGAVVTAVGAIIRYSSTRKYELAWKRTEFIFTQLRILETDKDLVEMVQILEDRHPSIKVSQLYRSDSELDEATRKTYDQKFDGLLNFLWRLCFAHLDLKTLSYSEMTSVGWYLSRVTQCPSLRDYCWKQGFKRVVIVGKTFEFSGEAENGGTEITTNQGG